MELDLSAGNLYFRDDHTRFIRGLSEDKMLAIAVYRTMTVQ